MVTTDEHAQDYLAELHPIEREMIARSEAAEDAGTPLTLDQLGEVHQEIVAERHKRLERDARASWRSMEGWGNVTTEEEWQAAVVQADEDYDSGQFLLDRLGAQRYLDPPLAAVLLTLRRRLVEEHGAETAAELMMVDMAVLSYYHTFRVSGWIGDFSQWLESEFFRKGGLTIRLHELDTKGRRDLKVRGLRVEEIVERLAEKLMPLLDRSNKMMLRNLKALQDHTRPAMPNVNIGQAAQVNVAHQQINTITEPPVQIDTDAGSPQWSTSEGRPTG
jgi:hypothetical protein